MLKKLLLIVLLVGLRYNLPAQDIQLSQFYETDLMLNPALAGRSHHHRLMGHQRIQWPGLAGKYLTSLVAYDTYSAKSKSGYGMYFLHDIQGRSNINSQDFSMFYSYDVHLDDVHSLRFGIQASIVSRHIDYSGLIYPDQLDDQGMIASSVEGHPNSRIIYPDFSTGALYYSNNTWLGYSAHHLTEPNQTFLDGSAQLPMKHTFIAGHKYKLGHVNFTRFTGYTKPFYIFPMVHYKLQGKSDQLDIGLHGMDDQLLFGVWYRGIPIKKYSKDLQNNESIILMAGWRLRHITLTYSYDFVVSKLRPSRTIGSHELNITYQFFRDHRHHIPKKLPCPDFAGPQKKVPLSTIF